MLVQRPLALALNAPVAVVELLLQLLVVAVRLLVVLVVAMRLLVALYERFEKRSRQ
jgi:Na+-transporting methylmalonyl-CoA/oxaloacetate decarboxylase gamma subunit